MVKGDRACINEQRSHCKISFNVRVLSITLYIISSFQDQSEVAMNPLTYIASAAELLDMHGLNFS